MHPARRAPATDWDFTDGRAPAEPADVAVEADASAIDVRFTVQQREPVTATQAVDGVGENSDDDVMVRFWPDGVSGFSYYFRATPRGTRYQGSSENATDWTAGEADRDGLRRHPAHPAERRPQQRPEELADAVRALRESR